MPQQPREPHDVRGHDGVPGHDGAAAREGVHGHDRVPDDGGGRDELAQRVRAAADGLRPLVATAREAQEARAKAQGAPRWTDVFTTQFTEFSNRPRLR